MRLGGPQGGYVKYRRKYKFVPDILKIPFFECSYIRRLFKRDD
jgi:hypothetical protein